jgi:adenylate kinase
MIEALIAVVAAIFGVGATTVYNQRKGTTAAQNADKVLADAKNKASDMPRMMKTNVVASC